MGVIGPFRNDVELVEISIHVILSAAIETNGWRRPHKKKT